MKHKYFPRTSAYRTLLGNRRRPETQYSQQPPVDADERAREFRDSAASGGKRAHRQTAATASWAPRRVINGRIRTSRSTNPEAEHAPGFVSGRRGVRDTHLV
ncbi:hypothetical protein AAFF_G00048750 [Aldrovandia affinis]|uniref:Uncharacterized protein n=1 Tax=Aldrovandia affinis TaxID=143900 RepID=A0AAD7S1L0_9TELE|nr:hypothetical protein AAFF_G00048750 [Aldrovandia affinis]